eukprot:COSAG01_NODE_3847_length_5644_cov_25.352209_5_plen_43_part_00
MFLSDNEHVVCMFVCDASHTKGKEVINYDARLCFYPTAASLP